MRRTLCILFLLASAVALQAADAPSETDLAGITYFAPVCPFYYRMMGPDGELREFQQLGDGFSEDAPVSPEPYVPGGRESPGQF